MQHEVQFAGFGGQGIMMIGKILAHAAMQSGSDVIWIPSYGPEMRGGTAYCTVVTSDHPIGSPIIQSPEHLVAMNRPSLEKFVPRIKSGGVVLVNSSLISITSGRQDIDEFRVPVVELVNKLGNAKVANIIALGAFTARSRIVSFDTLKDAVRQEFKGRESLITINLKALVEGRKAAKRSS